MVPIDWLTALMLGLLLPLAAAKGHRRYPPYVTLGRARTRHLRWAALIFAPITLFVLAWQPSWGFMYLFDPARHRVLAAALIAATAVLIVGLAALGFEASLRWISAGQRNRVLWSLIGTAIVMSAFVFVVRDRGFVVGDFEAWQSGTAVSFFRHALLPANLLLIPIVIAVYLMNFVWLGRESHREEDVTRALAVL